MREKVAEEGRGCQELSSRRSIVADTGALLTAASSSDLARATSLGEYLAPEFSRPAAELRELKAQAEAASGEETADLSLWYYVGDIRLYRRQLYSSEVTEYHNGTN